jgi:hypothetical protein
MERKFKSEYHKGKWEEAEKRREEVRAMRNSGMTWTAIGKVLGLTPQRVLQMGKSNVERNRPGGGFSPEGPVDGPVGPQEEG